MTCVGFFINVIKGFLESKEYFSYDDWEESTIENLDVYFDNFIKTNKIPSDKVDLFKRNFRRISPSDIITSVYIDDLPITKKAVDEIISDVKHVLVTKRSAKA
jgi:hypothetical protein